MFDVAPSPGFLKSIFPCLRKGTPQAGGSMAWVKLVDSEGRVAGHAVLSSRISMALLGGEVRHEVGALGDGAGTAAARLTVCWVSACITFQVCAACRPIPSHHPLNELPPAAPPTQGLMGPPSHDSRQRGTTPSGDVRMRNCGAPSDDGLSINQAAELPLPSPPATRIPPLGMPMPPAVGIPPPHDGPIAPPSGPFVPAAGGGKAPATATGGYLQVGRNPGSVGLLAHTKGQ